MTPQTPIKIGALAARTGTSTPTIRYYESIGLLPPPARAGSQRRYGPDAVRRLTFIRRCRDFGFPVDQVRALVALIDDPASDCTVARGMARNHLQRVREKLEELRALEAMIVDFAERWDATCVGGPGAECAALAHLAQPTEPPRR
jgi:DNA-binding transcriptional MerR regulator